VVTGSAARRESEEFQIKQIGDEGGENARCSVCRLRHWGFLIKVPEGVPKENTGGSNCERSKHERMGVRGDMLTSLADLSGCSKRVIQKRAGGKRGGKKNYYVLQL